MFKQVSLLCTSVLALHSSTLFGDNPGDASEPDTGSIFTQSMPFDLMQDSEKPEAEAKSAIVLEQPVVKKIKNEAPIRPFTGKVKSNKVRLRLGPDVDSQIVKELEKGTLLSVVGESDDFWVVEAPRETKAYVFRSFVLDGQVEGNRVNVRLQPNTEAPVLAHLNSGDRVEGTISTVSNKWLEVTPPPSVHFYVAKNYVENFGGPEKKEIYENKLRLAKQDMVAAEQFAESEMSKNFAGIDFDKITHKFQTIVQEYAEFSGIAEKAQETLSKVQEQYLDKRISYLESKTYEEDVIAAKSGSDVKVNPTDKMKGWEPVEEALYLSWVSVNDCRDMGEYYDDQKLAAQKISGILESYQAPVKCKPGDYFLKQDGLPVGYLYSTKVNLEDFIGKRITCIGTPRPNNNFAFPAFFVLEVQD